VEATQWVDMLEKACAISVDEERKEFEGFALNWRDSFSDANKLQNVQNDGKLHNTGTISEKTIKLSEIDEKDVQRDEGLKDEDWGNSPIGMLYIFIAVVGFLYI
jgi:hypothetical protein